MCAGLHFLPFALYVEQHLAALPATFGPLFGAADAAAGFGDGAVLQATTVLLAAGRLVCFGAEAWFVGAHIHWLCQPPPAAPPPKVDVPPVGKGQQEAAGGGLTSRRAARASSQARLPEAEPEAEPEARWPRSGRGVSPPPACTCEQWGFTPVHFCDYRGPPAVTN